MIEGHGDDSYKYGYIRADFSSNVPTGTDLSGLKAYLSERFETVMHYPEPEPRSLEREMAEQFRIDPDCIMITAGATDAIYLTARLFAQKRIAITEPTFAEYRDACRLNGCEIISTADPYSPPACVSAQWLCNPNNPTGRVWDFVRLQAAIEKQGDVFFVADQSYEYFTRQPLFAPAESVKHRNLIIIGSMTKRYAIPGLRLGYLIAPAAICNRLRLLRAPWSVNALAIEAGHYLLQHKITSVSPEILIEECARIARELKQSDRYLPEPTDTHFMLVRTMSGTAAALKKHLAQRVGILIRDASNFEGLTPDYFRIAALSKADNDLLINALLQWNG